MGTVHCLPHQPSEGQIKTPVQCEENPKGLGGVVIFDQETFSMNKQHLVAVLLSRGEKPSVVAESEMPPKT